MSLWTYYLDISFNLKLLGIFCSFENVPAYVKANTVTFNTAFYCIRTARYVAFAHYRLHGLAEMLACTAYCNFYRYPLAFDRVIRVARTYLLKTTYHGENSCLF